jgi:hypothetical protein
MEVLFARSCSIIDPCPVDYTHLLAAAPYHEGKLITTVFGFTLKMLDLNL